MNTKKLLALMCMAAVGSFCLSAQTVPNQSPQPYQGPQSPGPSKLQPQPGQPTQPAQPSQPVGPPTGQPNGKNMMAPKSDCSQLTPDEIDFANQLSPVNKALFCGKFSADMRASAMEQSGQMGNNGTLITNDQAVEKVAKDNGVMMAAPAAPAQRQGSCPTK